MMFQINHDDEQALRRIAEDRGCAMDVVLHEAIREYVVSASITDLSAEDMIQTQAKMLAELPGADDDWSGVKGAS